MRTIEEIHNELRMNGEVFLTSEESEAYGKDKPVDEDCVFLTYSETVTIGKRTITKTASASVPVSFGNENAVLGTLRKCVQQSEDISLAN